MDKLLLLEIIEAMEAMMYRERGFFPKDRCICCYSVKGTGHVDCKYDLLISKLREEVASYG